MWKPNAQVFDEKNAWNLAAASNLVAMASTLSLVVVGSTLVATASNLIGMVLQPSSNGHFIPLNRSQLSTTCSLGRLNANPFRPPRYKDCWKEMQEVDQRSCSLGTIGMDRSVQSTDRVAGLIRVCWIHGGAQGLLWGGGGLASRSMESI